MHKTNSKTKGVVVIPNPAMRLQIGLLVLATVSEAFTRPAVAAHASRVGRLRDADRCYYGDVDENGDLVKVEKKKQRGPALKPSPALTPLQVAEEQLQLLSAGSYSDIEDAFSFVSPKIVELNKMDATKFREVLESPVFDGLIGCNSWNVTMASDDVSLETASEEGYVAFELRVLPKPFAGCMRFSGLADQGGITWPSFYKWELRRQDAEPHAGCWMLEQMSPVSPEDAQQQQIAARPLASSAAE